MKKINVAKLLKDCPKGMELDCLICEKPVKYIELATSGTYIITIETSSNDVFYLTKEGYLYNTADSKCIIFPKGKTTWKGFIPPCKFKDGDIIYTKHKLGTEFVSIFQREYERDIITYWDINLSTNKLIGSLHEGNAFKVFIEKDKVKEQRFATEEEKSKLFQAIKENGYRWNTETKTLEKLVEPNFDVGDWIIRNNKYTGIPVKVIEFNGYYSCELNGEIVNLTRNDVHNNFHLWTIDDAKNGDVLVDKDNNIGIFQKFEGIYWYSYIYLGCDGKLRGFSIGGSHKQTDVHPATKEQRDLLFQKIKEAGYKWNSETKTLEKLIKPKFKVGDRVKQIGSPRSYIIRSVEFDRYILHNNQFIRFKDEHIYELVNKFDISTLVPFESRVLVRDRDNDAWRASFWGCLIKNRHGYNYDTTRGYSKQCIPYEGNEHLLGKVEDCKDFYKIWE